MLKSNHTQRNQLEVVGRANCIIQRPLDFVKWAFLFFLVGGLSLPSHGPPQKRLIRGPRVGVIAADFADGSAVLAQVFKGSVEIVAPKGLTIPTACVIMISSTDVTALPVCLYP